MAGRPPKPTKLLELTGAVRKNPGRYKDRAAEPASTGDIGGPPQKWMIFHPEEGYLRAEKLRAIWDDCVKMWPWLEFADRDALADYCQLKQKFDECFQGGRKMPGAEIAAMKSIRTELGGTGAGRARLGVRSPSKSVKAKPADPRAAFLAQRLA